MIRYPDDFDVPTFPAGKRIVAARLVSVGIALGLLGIVFLSGMILWTAGSKKIEPFLISVNPETGAWNLVGHEHNRMFSAAYTIQESLLRNFVINWFEISADAEKNDAVWQLCTADFCKSDEYNILNPRCGISCLGTADLAEEFLYNTVPTYQDYVATGTTWTVNQRWLVVKPVNMAQITDNGGMWQISARIETNMGGAFNVVAYARVEKNTESITNYPQTMGFYVSSFDAYKID